MEVWLVDAMHDSRARRGSRLVKLALVVAGRPVRVKLGNVGTLLVGSLLDKMSLVLLVIGFSSR